MQTQKLADKIKDIHYAMLTTTNFEGGLSSRPMTAQRMEVDGELWFFVSRNSTIAQEIRAHEDINVSFSKPEDSLYISISGRADLVDDIEKANELWNPAVKAFFPMGLADPQLALLRVRADHAEYWDSTSSRLVQAWKFAKAIVSGRPQKLGKHERLDFKDFEPIQT